MLREKKEMFSTNKTFYKLFKFLSETKIKRYEICNIVDDDGESIHAADIDELATNKGKILLSLEVIKDLANLIYDQQKSGVGSSLNNQNVN